MVTMMVNEGEVSWIWKSLNGYDDDSSNRIWCSLARCCSAITGSNVCHDGTQLAVRNFKFKLKLYTSLWQCIVTVLVYNNLDSYASASYSDARGGANARLCLTAAVLVGDFRH